jgi:hypothetical protein
MRALSPFIVAVVAATLSVSCGLDSRAAIQSRTEMAAAPGSGSGASAETPGDPAPLDDEREPPAGERVPAEAEQGTSEPTPLASEAPLPLGEPFTLQEGETAAIAGSLGVTFESVVGDSRCPVDVDCVWAGNAEIVLEVAKDGEEPASIHLNTLRDRGTEARYLEYTIELVDLEPKPRTDAPKDVPYRAELIVRQSEES